MAQLNWAIQAKNDLISIAEFIAQDSKKYARIQIRRIREKTRQLNTYPKSGRIVPELNNPHVGELIFGNYRIINKIVSEQ